MDQQNFQNHPLIGTLECLSCILKGSVYCARIATCGLCSNCNGQTPYSGQKYCSGCSWELKACHECGAAIMSGNDMLKSAEGKYDKLREKLKRYDSEIETLTESYKNLIYKYTDKTKDEIIKSQVN